VSAPVLLWQFAERRPSAKVDRMDHEPGSQDPPYRLGYREGFEDGFSFAAKAREPAKNQDKAPAEQKPQGAEQGEQKQGSDGDKDKPGHGAGHKDKTPLYKRPGLVAVGLLLLLGLIIAAILFWRHSRRHETTDDAFIDGFTSQMAAQTSGRVIKLYVSDNQHVNQGDPLLDIDSRDNDAREAQARGQLAAAQAQYKQSMAQIVATTAMAEQAEAGVREAEANWRKAVDDLARYKKVDPDAVPRQEVDSANAAELTMRAKLAAARMSAKSARSQVLAAEASSSGAQSQITSAEATVQATQLQTSYTHVVAPISGKVARRSVDVGNVISTGQPLLALVSDTLWVTANYKETQLTFMQVGQPVELVVDAFPKLTFRGRVDSIQKATGAYFSSLPAENATGNYVKVVQRVPVKITFSDNDYMRYAIGPGMSVSPDVTVR
jgi:membrane fusion protein, multidrug efflux system